MPLAPVADDDDPIIDHDPAEQGTVGTKDQPTDEDLGDWLPDWAPDNAAGQSER